MNVQVGQILDTRQNDLVIGEPITVVVDEQERVGPDADGCVDDRSIEHVVRKVKRLRLIDSWPWSRGEVRRRTCAKRVSSSIVSLVTSKSKIVSAAPTRESPLSNWKTSIPRSAAGVGPPPNPV